MVENPIIQLLESLIWLYWWVVIIAVIMSWLVAFGVVNTFNPFARTVVRFLDAVTEPVFRQVRRVIPPIGGLDLSPLIVLIFLQFLTWSIDYVYYRFLFQYF
jgi:YggT family protein